MRRVLIKALSQIGVKELLGAKHNESILNYFESIGHKWVTTDETAWCSAFINWAAKTAGFEYTGKLNARSWLNIGRSVVKPRVGDVVIFGVKTRIAGRGTWGCLYHSLKMVDIFTR